MITEKISEMFGYDYSTLNDYINNWKPVDELAWLNQFQDRRFIREIKDEEREYFDRGWHELREAKPDLQISYRDFVDNKIEVDGQRRKLFKYINDKELSELVGKYKLPKTKLYLVISTNFDDFLMCATKNPWTACTDLTDGDFRFTTMGNVFTKGRFIAYVTDLEKKEYEGLESYKMFYRCFGFVNKDGEMVGNIWYPIKTYMAFQDDHFKCVRDVKNKDAKYGFDKVFNKADFFVYPYLDYSILDTDTDKYYFSDDYLRFHPIIQYKDGEVVSYSDKIKFEGDCLFNMLWRNCDVCGTVRGNIQTIGDHNYCPDCYSKAQIKCDNCGKEILLKDAHFTEDNTWICSDCIEKVFGRKNVKTCSCGTLIRMKKKDHCKYCRSEKTDAFKNDEFSYFKNGNYNNLYTYWRHAYVPDSRGNCIPPHLRYDDDVFSETEKYLWHD